MQKSIVSGYARMWPREVFGRFPAEGTDAERGPRLTAEKIPTDVKVERTSELVVAEGDI